MRIDVALDHRDLDAELDALRARMQRPGDALHGMPAIATPLPGLVLKVRETGGEFHVYAEDLSRNALAGCTVFSRVPEVHRRADPYVRSPHSRYARAYRRQGVASTVYRWALQSGMCLVSGPRQSPGAHRLWHALARSNELAFVQAAHGSLRIVGTEVERPTFDAFETRMLLLGAGWTLQRFAGATQCGAGPESTSRRKEQ
jgi:hypothetical protein